MDMRKVRFQPRGMDWDGDPGLLTGAWYQHRLTKAVDFGAGRVEPVWSPRRFVSGTAATMDLPVTPTDLAWAVEVYSELPDGRGGKLKTTEIVQIPAGSYSTVLDFEDLVRVDRASLQPIVAAPTALELRLQAVEAAIAGGVGTGGAPAGTGTAGAYRVTDLEDITSVGEAVALAADGAAARSAIGAGTSNLALGTSGSTAAPGTTVGAASAAAAAASAAQLTADAAASAASTAQSTATAAQSAAAAAVAGLAAAPWPHYAVAGSYPGRPVTSRPVWWMSWDVAPPATSGTTTSGTGPVVGLDAVFLAVGVVPG